MARAETRRLREVDIAAALQIIKLRVLAGAQYAKDIDSIAEHDLLQIALTQLDEVRKTIDRARKARSGV